MPATIVIFCCGRHEEYNIGVEDCSQVFDALIHSPALLNIVFFMFLTADT